MGTGGTLQGTSEYQARHCSEPIYRLLESHAQQLSPYSWMLEEEADVPEAVEGTSHYWIGI